MVGIDFETLSVCVLGIPQATTDTSNASTASTYSYIRYLVQEVWSSHHLPSSSTYGVQY